MSIPISILIGYWLPNQMLRIAMEIYPFVDVFFPSTILHLQGISGKCFSKFTFYPFVFHPIGR